MGMTISKLTRQDIGDVLDISIECGLCLWSAEAYRSELIREDSIMLKLSNGSGPVVGFAVGRIFDFGNKEYTVELTNIGLRQTIRGKGFGTLLLKSFLNRSRAAGASHVILEVRVSNTTAIRFYERMGFAQSGRRRAFYADPVEDAYTMRLEL